MLEQKLPKGGEQKAPGRIAFITARGQTFVRALWHLPSQVLCFTAALEEVLASRTDCLMNLDGHVSYCL